MNATQTTNPDERPLGPIQAERLSALTGLPAAEFENQTVATLAQRLRWQVDPDLWLFRQVCGQVVKTDPATGAEFPVPYATVKVYDTVCDYWGFFPEPWPWWWLFPVECRTQLFTTVTTDECGNFCFWIPAFEIEWILRWREERICFPDIFAKPTVADLLANPQSTAAGASALVERLRPGSDLDATLGARAGAVLAAARASTGFGDSVGQLAGLLRSSAFTQPVTPPLTALSADTDQAAALPPGVDPGRFFGPFVTCVDVLVPEWYEFIAVPDVCIVVTQDIGGSQQTIYDGCFDIPWGINPIPPLTLQASQSAVASQAPCPPPQVNPDQLGFQYVGLLPVSAPYAAGGTFNGATGFATRVNQPHPAPPPPGGCACDESDLTVAPTCPATAVFFGELNLYGGVSYPGAAYYRIMSQYAPGSGLPTPATASFSAAAPMTPTYSVPQSTGTVTVAPVNPDGWYAIQNFTGPYEGYLMDWKAPRADGVYLLTLELADASFNPIPLSPAPTLLLVADASAPVPSPFTVSWQPTTGVNGPIDPAAWTTAYPPASGCALIDTGGSAIALQFSASVTATHLRQAEVGVGGCGGGTLYPSPANPPGYQWYTASTAPSATSFSFTGVYYLPAGSPAGCYSFALYADSRAFNSAGGSSSDPVATGWCEDEPAPPYTNPVITIAII